MFGDIWLCLLPKTQWQLLGLNEWRIPRLRQFQNFTDSVTKFWGICGHIANFIRIGDNLDDLGAEITLAYITEQQLTVSSLFQEMQIQYNNLLETFDILPKKDLLMECHSILVNLKGQLLPRDEWTGYAEISLDELKEWHVRLTEALNVIVLAELALSADALGLQCDFDRLIEDWS